ncbi:hypothetical protein Vi05172_g8740 [Venturia inaequalis]|nr:hypothetical protein Vi05172_g8740 [Venturia inaequalis]
MATSSHSPVGSQAAPSVTSPTLPPVTSPKVKDPRKNEDGTLKLGLKMATIYVGDQVEPFIVHHALITASSDYFAKALNGEFKEKDGIVRLEGQDPATFTLYVQCLYSGSAVTGVGYPSFLDQCILGNYIQDRGYKNALNDKLIDHVAKMNRLPTHLAQRAWESLPESSPFLTLLVDFWVHAGNASWYQETDGSWKSGDVTDGPIKMWRRVALGLVNTAGTPALTSGNRPWELNRCKYHEHEEGEPKCV